MSAKRPKLGHCVSPVDCLKADKITINAVSLAWDIHAIPAIGFERRAPPKLTICRSECKVLWGFSVQRRAKVNVCASSAFVRMPVFAKTDFTWDLTVFRLIVR